MTEQVDNTNVEAPEPTHNEVEARNGGWVPKEEYHGDENKWVDADEFVRRGPLFEKINSTTRELKEVKKALAQLSVHHASVKETAYKEALATLKTQKRDALTDGDPDKLIEIDEKMNAVREEQRRFEIQRAQEVAQNVEATIHPEFEAWINRNSWYQTSKPMKAFADALGTELRSTGMTPHEVLKRIEVQIKEEFPQKFRNVNRDKNNSVEGTSSKSNSKSNSSDQLSDMERKIMERFVRHNIMTKEQYIADLKKAKED